MNVAEAVKYASLANDEIKQSLPPIVTHVRLGVWFSVAVCAHGMRGVMFHLSAALVIILSEVYLSSIMRSLSCESKILWKFRPQEDVKVNGLVASCMMRSSICLLCPYS